MMVNGWWSHCSLVSEAPFCAAQYEARERSHAVIRDELALSLPPKTYI